MARDGDLVRAALRGESAALDELVRQHLGGVRLAVMARLGSWHPEVDDITQEALLCGIRDLARLRDPERVGGWLAGIARHLSLGVLRDKRRAPVSLNALPAAEPVDSRPPREPHHTPLLEEVAALPDKLQEALLLFYVEKESYQEIATRLGITPAAVNRRLTRARNQLRERLLGREESRDDR